MLCVWVFVCVFAFEFTLFDTLSLPPSSSPSLLHRPRVTSSDKSSQDKDADMQSSGPGIWCWHILDFRPMRSHPVCSICRVCTRSYPGCARVLSKDGSRCMRKSTAVPGRPYQILAFLMSPPPHCISLYNNLYFWWCVSTSPLPFICYFWILLEHIRFRGN